MKKLIFVFILLFGLFTFGTSPASAARVASLPDVLKVEQITVDDNQLYVTENASVYIYSLTDFKLKKKFGKQGEGPQEFMLTPFLRLFINAQTDDLIVNSLGKVSFYTKEGVFKKELKTTGLSFVHIPLGDQSVAMGISVKDGIRYRTVNVYDGSLKKVKEVYRTKDTIQQAGEIKAVEKAFDYYTHDDKIIVAGKEEFVIDVLDKTGKQLHTIGQKGYKRVKFTEEHKKNLIESFKTNPQTKQLYQSLKDRITFPAYFPAVLTIVVADARVYVMSWEKEGDKFKFFIYGIDGKLQQTTFLHIQLVDAVLPYPFWFHNQKLYQTVENDETEEFELHITEVK